MKHLKDGEKIKSFRYYSTTPMQNDFTIAAHDDEYEMLYFISGDVNFYVEGNAYRLKKGDLIIVRSDEHHVLKLRSTNPYERIVVVFDPQILNNIKNKDKLLSIFCNRAKGKNNRFSATSSPDNYWFHYMDRINMAQNEDEKVVYLLPLLNDLANLREENNEAEPIKKIDPAFEILNYINAHFTEPLSLDAICDKFFISKAQLNRIIKKSTKTTVWNYIHNQRLEFAHELLCEGQKAINACELSGYTDYVSFYKAYKKKYHKAPSEAQIKRKYRSF